MNPILIALLAIAVISACVSMLAVALATGDVRYLLIESLIVHFMILFAALAAFEKARRDG